MSGEEGEKCERTECNIRELGYHSDISNSLQAGRFGIPSPGSIRYYFFFYTTFQTGPGAMPRTVKCILRALPDVKWRG
jgi:hypothetical protein